MSVFLILLLSTITSLAMAQAFHPDIPRAWDDREVETFEVPLAQPDRSARYLSAAEYYALDVMPIYRSYPVYAPGREPAGYMESLKDYVKIYTTGTTITTKYKISDMEVTLADKGFLRVHRSFIVNLKHLSAFTSSDVEIGKIEIPIGESYKELVFKRLRAP